MLLLSNEYAADQNQKEEATRMCFLRGQFAPCQFYNLTKIRGEFGGEFLPAEYGIHIEKLRHRRPVSL